MIYHVMTRLLMTAPLLLSLVNGVTLSHAQTSEDLKSGVVKITAQQAGKAKVGTGFIVRLEQDIAYIVTASHVIEEDPQPKIVFRPKETRSYTAQVKGARGDDRRGLAVLVVQGELPQGLNALQVNPDLEVNGGEEVSVIGFPLVPKVPWAVTPGVVTGQEGEYLVFSGAAAEGNSGSPVLLNGKVIGVVTEVLSQYGYAVPIPILRLALRGWGVPLDAAPKEAKRLPEAKGTKDQLPKEITGKDGAPMVLISAGSFQMGSTKDEVDRVIQICIEGYKKVQQSCEGWYKHELPQHQVLLDAFYLDKYEVTNRLFNQFVQQSGYRTTAEQGGSAGALVTGKGWDEVKGANWQEPEGSTSVFQSNRGDHPVVTVSWHDAVSFCRWAGKRLPTEAEWEYAARAGTSTRYWWGDGNPGVRRVENIADESAKHLLSPIMSGYNDGAVRTAPVGSYEANPWGLYDIGGNVAEWTADWYDENYYIKSPARNPKGPSNGQYRVFRGGSWINMPDRLRSADRIGLTPTARDSQLGFRCAQDIPQ